jgi:hypothetical protein
MKHAWAYLPAVGVLALAVLAFRFGTRGGTEPPEEQDVSEGSASHPSITVTIRDEALEELKRLAADKAPDDIVMDIVILRDE